MSIYAFAECGRVQVLPRRVTACVHVPLNLVTGRARGADRSDCHCPVFGLPEAYEPTVGACPCNMYKYIFFV